MWMESTSPEEAVFEVDPLEVEDGVTNVASAVSEDVEASTRGT